MNCKPGDLAFMVRSQAGNEGRIVLCIRLSPFDGLIAPGGVSNKGDVWEIEPPMRAWDGSMTSHALDRNLRPIRPGDISDEEVRDLYAPKQTEAA